MLQALLHNHQQLALPANGPLHTTIQYGEHPPPPSSGSDNHSLSESRLALVIHQPSFNGIQQYAGQCGHASQLTSKMQQLQRAGGCSMLKIGSALPYQHG
jgi:hypothetical protein